MFIENLGRCLDQNFYEMFCLDLEYDNTEDAANKFTSALQAAAGNMMISDQPPWWDNELETLKKDRISALNIFKRTRFKHHLDLYITKRSAFRNVYRHKENAYKDKQYCKLMNAKRDPKEFLETC